MQKILRILTVLLSEVIALICLCPNSTVMAQQIVTPLDKNDPELRAILTEIEADAEKARLKAKIPGMSIVIVHDQDVLLAKGFHYSGLPREAPMLYEYQVTDEQPSVEEQLQSLKDVEMLVPAMTEYSYSNLGYNIMGLALSRFAKQPYDQYVMGHILKPLGMNLSGFALTEQMKSHFAVGHDSVRPDGTHQRSAYPQHGLVSRAASKPHLAQPRTATANAPVTIPFELVIRHIVVQARINNSRPLSFVFDTGAKECVVNADVAKELGLKLEGQLRMGGAGADTLPGSFVRDAKWTLAGLESFSQPVSISIPLGRLAARFGHDFDGIIGADFIQQFVVEVDYKKRVLRLHDKDRFNYTGAGESVPMELNSAGHLQIEAEVTPDEENPIKGKFVLDLGSGGSLVLMSPVVNEHNLLGSGLKTYRAIGVGGVGGQSTGQIGRVRELKIAKFAIANPMAMFLQDKPGPMASRGLIGNIGQQIASKFKVFLDYQHGRIILEPNHTFADKMDRAVSGVALTTDGKDYRTIRIAEVLENSPAAEAGLRKDDIIVSVNKKPVTELTVTKLMEMFEQPRQRKLTIKRNEQTLKVTLTPRQLV